MVAVCVLLAIVAAGLLAGRIAPYSYQHFDIGLDAINLGPTAAGHHFFGTDGVGHDVLSQTLFGIKTTVFVGLFVGVCASLLGIVVGAVAGWFGGWLDALLMRVVDCLVTIPALAVLFTGIVLTQRQPRPHWVTEALILYLWISMARVVRASFVQLREAEFVEAARAAGASGARIVLRHVLPNASAAVIVTATGIVGQAMLLEATVEFFGYGFDPWVTPSLGGLISRGANSGLGLDNGVFTYWWLWAFPAAALVLVLTCINFIGDSLDEALNPAGQR